MNSFQKFLKKSKKGKTLILTHRAADIDAICSAAVMHSIIKNSSIGIPGYLNNEAKAVSEKFKIPYILNPLIEEFSAIIILDFNNAKMAGSLGELLKQYKKPTFLIDHHSNTKQQIAKKKFSIIKPQAVSTTEIIFQLLKKSHIKINPKNAKLLALGIVSDSAGFSTANSQTFSFLSELLQTSKSDFSEILTLSTSKTNVSQKIASLKAAKRARIFKCNDFIISLSEVSCFENIAADSLVLLGSDIAFVGFADSKMNARINARASEEFVKKTGFDLPKHVMLPLGERFSGNSGGHACAAGFDGTAIEIMPLLEECFRLSFEFLKKKGMAFDFKELKE